MAAAFFQQASTRNFPGAAQDTVAITATAGHAFALYVGWTTAAVTLNSIDDSKGNTWTLKNNPTTDAGNGRMALAYAYNVAGGATTITVHYSGDPGLNVIMLHEVSGIDTASDPFDASGASCPGGTGAGAISVSTSSNTTQNGDYLFAGVFDNQTNDGGITVGTGYTKRVDLNASSSGISEDQVQATAGATSAGFTMSAFSHPMLGVLALKAAAAGGTTRGMPFGTRGTAFSGGRTFKGPLCAPGV